ncbi:MAG: YdcF family protein [Kiloniellales bacterium]
MNNLALEFLLLPMPLLWLLLLGLALWRWRRLSRGLMVAATVIFTLLALPLVGRALLAPLAAGALPYDEAAAVELDAIVVPTGGAFPDGAGRWWPTQSSIVRATAGRELQQATGLPLILTGGTPYPGEPPEAVSTAEALAIVGPAVRFDTTARNSAESAATVAAMLREIAGPGSSGDDGARRVILVTSPGHVARMSASLRHHGIEVFAAAAADPRPPRRGPLGVLEDYVPSDGGLRQSRAALYEYMGIAWYLLTGRITLADLRL